MNSLSLRVASVKSVKNVNKNGEIRSTIAFLPKHYEFSEELFCIDFRNATNIPEQVAVVKKVARSLNTDPQALQFLSDLYLCTAPKHPVRNQILKLLSTAAHSSTDGMNELIIVAALSKTIQRLVEETKTSTESSQWNITIVSLSGCMENFSCGVKALEQSLPIVFPFLCNSVQKYLADLGDLSSPPVRNEYYLNVHNSLRFILACVQEFAQHMKLQYSIQLKQLSYMCKEIIPDNQIPMDTRAIAGIIMAYVARIFDYYEEFIQEVKAVKQPKEIALCVGIINSFSYDDFLHLSADIRDICSKIDEIANAHSTVPCILLSAARSLFQLSKILLQFELLSTAKIADDVKLILRKLLNFTFCYLEHQMDSLRHICKDLLRNIIALAKKISFDFLLQEIFDSCNSERLSLSMKCVVLLQVVTVLGTQQILDNCKDIFTCLFAKNLGRDFIVNNLFEGLMCASHKELPYEAWQSLWVVYILQIAAASDSRLPDIEILVVKAVKCEPRIVQYIIEDVNKTIPLSTKLSSLWTVRKCGIKLSNFNEIMENFSLNLRRAILSNCDETRIMALRLLVETHKTTELLTQLECEHLLLYLEYNSNCQSPATRQKSLALLSKALLRCELNLQRYLKDCKVSTSDSQPLQLRFLKEVLRILFDNLFKGANFSRRSVSLQLLEQALRIALNCELDLANLLPPQTVPLLLDILGDSYEANKELGVRVLKLIAETDPDGLLETAEAAGLSVADIQRLLVSVRPLDSVTAAYRLEFYCSIAPAAVFGNCEQTSYSPVYFSALHWLLQLLKQGLTLVKGSITEAAKRNPIYGVLFACNHLLKRLDFVALANDIDWRVLIAEMTILCKELTEAVASVVNSDSPEGHLPNDFSALPAEITGEAVEPAASKSETNSMKRRSETCKILSRKASKVDLDALKTTPQMVLLCAWRTVKEVSLILGEIVLRSPIQLNQQSRANFLLTKVQILNIGEHFKHLLAETKHRGAFEQAYVGFSKLCTRLWQVEALHLNCLPMQWLRELISLIAGEHEINGKICATRRSAGIPFMVQALVISELQMGTMKSLYFCVSQLFRLCANRTDSSAESRTHALNILRALFRCTDLSEAVDEYISEGVVCAIRSYGADTWSEKNSATLLFAALITRIFGVQRFRDSENLYIRNRMTGRIFFLRYPNLYDFFLKELNIASTLVSRGEKTPKLQPLLLLLSRLYPSALEGTESNLKLTEFLPFISNCSACPEMRTRYLAAKAFVALIAKDAVHISVLKKCAEILESVDDPRLINLNLLHGQLLQILLLIKSHKAQDAEFIGDISCTLATFHEKLNIKNAVILKVMLDILIEILSCIKSFTLSQETIQNLLYFSTQTHFYDAKLSFYYPVFRNSFFLYNLHMLRLTLPCDALVDFLLTPPLTHPSVYPEQAETCLNVLLLVLLHRRASSDKLAEFEFTEGELDFMRSLTDDTIDDLCAELRQSKALHSALKEVIKQPRFYPECVMKAYAVLSLLDNFDFTLNSLVTESKKHPGDVKSALTMCVERLVLQKGLEFKTCQICLEYLAVISQSWQPYCLRLKASTIMSHIAVHYRKAVERKNLSFMKMFISLMVSLLMDDDYDIRDIASKTVLRMIPEDLGLENAVATMAQRLFLHYTADILVAIKADDNFVLSVFKVIVETQAYASFTDQELLYSNTGIQGSTSAASNSSSTDLEVFDKIEANVFAEPLKVIADAIEVFKSTFSTRIKVMEVVTNYTVS